MPATYIVYTIAALNHKKISDGWDGLVNIEKSGEAARSILQFIPFVSQQYSTHSGWYLVLYMVHGRKHDTAHSSVTITGINKIDLCKHSTCLQIQLNFGCLCRGHAEVCSNTPALLTLVEVLPPCCKIAYCTVLQ